MRAMYSLPREKIKTSHQKPYSFSWAVKGKLQAQRQHQNEDYNSNNEHWCVRTIISTAIQKNKMCSAEWEVTQAVAEASTTTTTINGNNDDDGDDDTNSINYYGNNK